MGKIFLTNPLKVIQNHTQKLENFLIDKDMIIQLGYLLGYSLLLSLIALYYSWFFQRKS